MQAEPPPADETPGPAADMTGSEVPTTGSFVFVDFYMFVLSVWFYWQPCQHKSCVCHASLTALVLPLLPVSIVPVIFVVQCAALACQEHGQCTNLGD